jgi:hypothetical protein
LKIIDAVWEKRNLGVTCFEVRIETADSWKEVENQLNQLNAQYVVVKVPAGRSDIMIRIASLGYIFIEGSIHVSIAVKNVELSGIQKRLGESVDYGLMEANDLDVLWNELRSGMHDTDRIYLDLHFTKKQAADRYIGWIQDEMCRGTDAYKMTYKGQSVGYFMMKDLGEGIYYPFLAGMYKSNRNPGLGFNICYKPICEIKARGGKSISSYISTNNEKSVRIHADMGFSFDEITYVYVKHN